MMYITCICILILFQGNLKFRLTTYILRVAWFFEISCKEDLCLCEDLKNEQDYEWFDYVVKLRAVRYSRQVQIIVPD